MSANKIQNNFMPLLTILLEEHQKPKRDSNEQLAEEFAEHFMAKI